MGVYVAPVFCPRLAMSHLSRLLFPVSVLCGEHCSIPGTAHRYLTPPCLVHTPRKQKSSVARGFFPPMMPLVFAAFPSSFWPLASREPGLPLLRFRNPANLGRGIAHFFPSLDPFTFQLLPHGWRCLSSRASIVLGF